MRGYVEALEAAHKFGVESLSEVERGIIRNPSTGEYDHDPEGCAYCEAGEGQQHNPEYGE